MKRFSIILLVFFILGCELIVDVKVPFETEQLVVNSFVTPDSLWSAAISLNQSVLAKDNSPYKRVTNATITIHDENGPVATLHHVGDGNYRSQTEKPQVGKQYTIRVSAPNHPEVEAKSMIPNAAIITSVEIESTFKDDDPIVMAKIKFKDNGDTKDYYHIRLEEILEVYDNNSGQVNIRTFPEGVSSDNPDLNAQYISTDAGLLVKDVLFNGKQTEIRVKLQNGQNFFYYAGIRVVLRSVSEDYYNYQATRKLQNETSEDPFAQPASVYNNITNGFGIFAGLSSSAFEYYNRQPVITEISPSSGKAGDIITITGQNFGSIQEPPTYYVGVTFNSSDGSKKYVQASEVTDTQLKVVVPVGAMSGKLVLYRDACVTISDMEFQVTN